MIHVDDSSIEIVNFKVTELPSTTILIIIKFYSFLKMHDMCQWLFQFWFTDKNLYYFNVYSYIAK